MSYLDAIEKELRDILDIDEADAELWNEKIVKFVREKLLESYKNGRKAGKWVKEDNQRSSNERQKSPAGNHRKA